QQAGGGLEHLGAQRAHGPQELAVLHHLGLAAEAAFDVTALGPAERHRAVGRGGEILGEIFTAHHRILPSPSPHPARDASSSWRPNSCSRSLLRARWSRTLAADSEMPSSAAIAS